MEETKLLTELSFFLYGSICNDFLFLIKIDIKITILFTVPFIFDSYFFLIFKTVLLSFLDFMIGVRHFNIKKSIWNSWIWFHFRSAVLWSLSWSVNVLSDFRCHLLVCIWYVLLYFCLPAESYILYCLWRRMFLNLLAKTFVSISNKGSILCTLLSVFLK